MKYIILNIFVGLLGIILVCIAGAYVVWFLNYAESLKSIESFKTILFIIIGSIIPTIIIGGTGFLLFIKVLYDPFENSNY